MKFIVFICLFSLSIFAQDNKIGVTYGIGAVEGESVTVSAIDYQRFLKDFSLLGGKLKLGVGARVSFVSSDEFAIHNDDEIIEDVNLTATNLAVYTEYQLDNLVVGFNIDIFGVTSGDESDFQNSSESESPVSNNILLGGDNDSGTLNSEFWLGYNFAPFTIRGGLAHVVIEYEGDNPKNEKRQKFFDTFFLSAQYNF